MTSQRDLLEELASVYARAAVDEFLAVFSRAGGQGQVVHMADAIHEGEGIPETKVSTDSVASSYSAASSDSAGCKITEDPTHPPTGRKP
jgi:hypothetical protein